MDSLQTHIGSFVSLCYDTNIMTIHASSWFFSGFKRALASLQKSPRLLLLMFTQALKHRWLLPLDAIRFFLEKGLHDVTMIEDWSLQAKPPGLLLRAKLSIMENHVQVSVVVSIVEIKWTEQCFRIRVQADEVHVHAPSDSPIHSMLALVDLTKPGDLIAWLPSAVPGLVEGTGNQVVFDLFEIPAIRNKRGLMRMLQAIPHIARLVSVRAGRNVLVLQWQCMLRNLPAAIQSLVAKKSIPLSAPAAVAPAAG